MRWWRISLGDAGRISVLRAAIEDPLPLLRRLGALVIAQAKQAWREQRLGTVVWPERYPKQQGDFINIAPVVFQAGLGRTPTSIDFERRPALRDRFGVSIAEGVAMQDVDAESVTVGHKEPWAGVYQFGLVSRIPITQTTRETLWEWLFGSSDAGPRRGREDYARKLSFVFWRDELVGKPYERPFLGLTTQLEDDVDREIARFLGADGA